MTTPKFSFRPAGATSTYAVWALFTDRPDLRIGTVYSRPEGNRKSPWVIGGDSILGYRTRQDAAVALWGAYCCPLTPVIDDAGGTDWEPDMTDEDAPAPRPVATSPDRDALALALEAVNEQLEAARAGLDEAESKDETNEASVEVVRWEAAYQAVMTVLYPAMEGEQPEPAASPFTVPVLTSFLVRIYKLAWAQDELGRGDEHTDGILEACEEAMSPSLIAALNAAMEGEQAAAGPCGGCGAPTVCDPYECPGPADSKPLPTFEGTPRADALLAALVPHAERLAKDGHATPLDALLWFCAYQEAEVEADSNTLRDWARLFQAGHPGYKTLADAEAFLCSLEDEDGSLSLPLLREFFELGEA